MKVNSVALVLACSFVPASVSAQSFKAEVAPLIESSCIPWHDAETETGLNLEALGHDLSDAETFRKWERVFDRVHDGEMLPESEDRPDPTQLQNALPVARFRNHPKKNRLREAVGQREKDHAFYLQIQT